jgi:hypothetical protein
MIRRGVLVRWSLRRRIEYFLKRTPISASRLGLDVTGDPKLVFEIRKGRVPRARMESKIIAYVERVEREMGLPPPRIRTGRPRR